MIRGDWKWFYETFGFRQFYAAKKVCHMCDATKEAGPFAFTDFGDDPGWESTLKTTDDFISDVGPSATELPCAFDRLLRVSQGMNLHAWQLRVVIPMHMLLCPILFLVVHQAQAP